MPAWTPSEATRQVRSYAVSKNFTLMLTKHARERLTERDLQVGDVLHLLSRGFIYGEPERATQPTLFKYEMEATTPNSHGRTLKAVIIPHPSDPQVKVVTVMWKD